MPAPPTDLPAPPLSPFAIIGRRYRLIQPLGQGGMASVWAATDLTRGFDVAIKFLSGEHAASPAMRARFEQEASTLRQLRGPNIVAIHDSAIDEHGRPYIVMEVLDGEDLKTRLERRSYLGLEETAAMLGALANGLQRAHAAGIVHRDLKPANVFFARAGGEERVVLVDFGIAKITHPGSEAEATRTGTVMGTFNYMSPEQMMDSKNVDHRADVWSLGVIAFRAITGMPPFPGTEYPDLFAKINYNPIPAASQVAPELRLPPAIDAFFRRALERDRNLRFQTAPELAAAFQRVVLAVTTEATAVYAPSPAGLGPGAEPRTQPTGDRVYLPPETVVIPNTVAAVARDSVSRAPTPRAPSRPGRTAALAVGGLAIAAGLAVAGVELAGRATDGPPARDPVTATAAAAPREAVAAQSPPAANAPAASASPSAAPPPAAPAARGDTSASSPPRTRASAKAWPPPPPAAPPPPPPPPPPAAKPKAAYDPATEM